MDTERGKTITEVKDKGSDEDIAAVLGRSVGAFKIRLNQVALKMFESGDPPPDILKATGLSKRNWTSRSSGLSVRRIKRNVNHLHE